MNRRSFFSFLVAGPVGVFASAVRAKTAWGDDIPEIFDAWIPRGFFKHVGPLTEAERAEFKRMFIDHVTDKGTTDWSTVELTKHSNGQLSLRAFSHPDNVRS